MKETLFEASNKIFDAVRRVQSGFITERDVQKSSRELLEILLDMTHSETGFIAEILKPEEGCYRFIAVSPELERLSNLGQLFMTVIKRENAAIFSGEAVLEGNQDKHGKQPELDSILMLPIHLKGQVVGVAGVANNPLHYNQQLLDVLKPYLEVCGELIPAMKQETRRKEDEEELQRNYQNQKVINALLSLSLEDLPLESLLDKALDLCVSSPWLLPEARGCIFLADEEEKKLVMKAWKGILQSRQKACSEVCFGKCLCGSAAEKQVIQFSSGIDGNHVVSLEEEAPHGHYCIPITLSGKCLGVLNVYLKEGHQRNISEEHFLSAVANTLAIVIQRRKAEQALQEREASLAYAQSIAKMGNFDLNISTEAVRWSDEVFRIFGLNPKTDVFNDKTFVNHVHPEDLPFVREVLNSAIYNHEPYKVTFRIIRPDGKVRYVKEQAEVTYDLNGRPTRMVGTVHDITEQTIVNERIKKTLDNLHSAFKGSIKAMASTVEMKDPYTAGHQRRVADLARAIGEYMGLSKKQVEGVQMAGLIHDFGKISVPAEILSKPGRITEIEFGLIKHHSQVAYDVLKTVDFPWPIAEIVLQHHERMDGSGYPNGLKGDEIRIEARILAVADVVEAIASHRPYRASLGVNTALEEIKRNKGILYDAEAVDACLQIVHDSKFNLDMIS